MRSGWVGEESWECAHTYLGTMGLHCTRGHRGQDSTGPTMQIPNRAWLPAVGRPSSGISRPYSAALIRLLNGMVSSRRRSLSTLPSLHNTARIYRRISAVPTTGLIGTGARVAMASIRGPSPPTSTRMPPPSMHQMVFCLVDPSPPRRWALGSIRGLGHRSLHIAQKG